MSLEKIMSVEDLAGVDLNKFMANYNPDRMAQFYKIAEAPVKPEIVVKPRQLKYPALQRAVSAQFTRLSARSLI